MKEFLELTSQRGVKCHTCGAWVRPSKTFYRWSYPNGQYEGYKNYCAGCVSQVIDEEIAHSQVHIKTLRGIKAKAVRLRDIYRKADREACQNCQSKYKHITGKCDPTRKCNRKFIWEDKGGAK